MLGIFFGGNCAHAGGGAAFDLGEQAGAVAVGEHTVFAGAQLEYFLQNFYAVAHGVAIGVGPEVLVGLFQAASVVGKLGVGVPMRKCAPPGSGMMPRRSRTKALPSSCLVLPAGCILPTI